MRRLASLKLLLGLNSTAEHPHIYGTLRPVTKNSSIPWNFLAHFRPRLAYHRSATRAARGFPINKNSCKRRAERATLEHATQRTRELAQSRAPAAFFDLLIIQIVLNYGVQNQSEAHSSRARTQLS